jgi:hypothetical protein
VRSYTCRARSATPALYAVPASLDELNGIACFGFGWPHATMRPVGSMDGYQVLAHDGCDERREPMNR